MGPIASSFVRERVRRIPSSVDGHWRTCCWRRLRVCSLRDGLSGWFWWVFGWEGDRGFDQDGNVIGFGGFKRVILSWYKLVATRVREPPRLEDFQLGWLIAGWIKSNEVDWVFMKHIKTYSYYHKMVPQLRNPSIRNIFPNLTLIRIFCVGAYNLLMWNIDFLKKKPM